MLKVLALLAAGAVVLSGSVLGSFAAQARDMAAIRACGGPAKSYNQCLHVCGCMGGTVCYKSCGMKNFSRVGGKKGGGKRKQK